MGRISRVGSCLLGLGALVSSLSCSPSAEAQSPNPIGLECSLAEGPWQRCQMEVIEVGRHWFLTMGRDRFEFTHDGTGKVRMGLGGVWVEVTPRWEEDQTLCWGRLCARGDIPLD